MTDRGNMRFLFFLVSFMTSLQAFAASCDCELMVLSPMTGSHRMAPATLKNYQLENYASITVNSRDKCRNSCLKEFQSDMSVDRLKALLLVYSQRLIDQRLVGYNCTGLTTFQYPVVLKASLGPVSLGNVYQSLEVVTHEEACF